MKVKHFFEGCELFTVCRDEQTTSTPRKRLVTYVKYKDFKRIATVNPFIAIKLSAS